MDPDFALTTALFFISIIRIGCQVYHDPLPDLLGTENFISTLWEEQPLPPDPWDADYITPYTLSGAPVKEEEGIMVLDKDNFDNVIQNTPKIIVVFYSPKCERSKTFMPVYKQIHGEMGKKDSTIKLGKINVDTNGHLLRYGAGDLPLFILFKNQHASPQYQGKKEKNPLVEWIQKEFSQAIASSTGYSPYRRRAPENSKGADFDGQSPLSVIVDMDDSDQRPMDIESYPRELSPELPPPTTPTPAPGNAVLSQLSPAAKTPAPTLPSPAASQTSPPAKTSTPAPTLLSPTASQTRLPLEITLPSSVASELGLPVSITLPSSVASELGQLDSSVRYVERDLYDKRQLNSPVRYVERDDKRRLNSPGRYVERDSYDRSPHDYHERGYDRDNRRGHGHKHDHRSDRDSYSRRHGRSDHRHDRDSYGRRGRGYDYFDRR